MSQESFSLPEGLALPAGLDAFTEGTLPVALSLSARAGRLLRESLEARGRHVAGLEFKGRRELVTRADRDSEELLVRGIRRAFPEHAILAEEGVASPAGEADRESSFCWVLDPLDGTTNYVSGHPFYCVSVGLLREGEPWLGVVHAPSLGGTATGTFHYGGRGIGAWKNGRPIRVSDTAALEDAVVATGFSYNRNEEGVNTNLANFGRVLMEARGIRRCGSAALDLALTAEGIYDAFWES
ncbi:MAG: inositol monophosphatase family protein [Planctomycetota bacterium]